MADRKQVFIKTYGCQMNVYDSQRMGEALESTGYDIVTDADNADLILLNTIFLSPNIVDFSILII